MARGLWEVGGELLGRYVDDDKGATRIHADY